VERVLAVCAWLAERPRSGKARPDLAWRLRSFPVGRYTIFFRPMGYGIQVVSFLHQSRDIEAEFARRRRAPRKAVPPKARKHGAS
jgi:plasmid stabilization system protein ParE